MQKQEKQTVFSVGKSIKSYVKNKGTFKCEVSRKYNDVTMGVCVCVCVGGGVGVRAELFTCPYPLKVQARQYRVLGREGRKGVIKMLKHEGTIT